jgi:hypothetical protein
VPEREFDGLLLARSNEEPCVSGATASNPLTSISAPLLPEPLLRGRRRQRHAERSVTGSAITGRHDYPVYSVGTRSQARAAVGTLSAT